MTVQSGSVSFEGSEPGQTWYVFRYTESDVQFTLARNTRQIAERNQMKVLRNLCARRSRDVPPYAAILLALVSCENRTEHDREGNTNFSHFGGKQSRRSTKRCAPLI